MTRVMGCRLELLFLGQQEGRRTTRDSPRAWGAGSVTKEKLGISTSGYVNEE